MKNYKERKAYNNIMNTSTVIYKVKTDGLQNITVKNKYKEVNVVPDFGGTTFTQVERDFVNYPLFSDEI
jgi:hypothetical protein